MFPQLSQSWELARASAAVLRADKALIVFPIISAILSLIVTVSFFVPVLAFSVVHNVPGNNEMHSPLGYLVMFLFYLVQYFVIFFANTALVGAALIRLRGGNPTVKDGFQLAMGRIGVIFGYAVIASTVGMVLRTISERSGLLGRIFVGLFGMAWNLATYLVAPVLIAENVSPTDAIKRSTALLKQTWGEQIIGNAGIGSVFTLFGLLMVLVCGVIVYAGVAISSTALLIGAAVLFVLGITALFLVQAALSGIYTAAVYLYAAEGFTGGPFDPSLIRNAFRQK